MKTPKARARAKKRARRVNKKRSLNGYRSGFELNTSKILQQQQRKLGFSWGYETDTIEYLVPSRLAKYTPDFPIVNKDGHVWYLETKGRFLVPDRKKHLLIKEQRPDIDIRIFFMKDQPIRKGSKTKYSDWCRKNNVPFCVKDLNMEWFDEG